MACEPEKRLNWIERCTKNALHIDLSYLMIEGGWREEKGKLVTDMRKRQGLLSFDAS